MWIQLLVSKRFCSVEINLKSISVSNQISLTCKLAGVTRILICGVLLNNKLTSAYISSVSKRISNIGQNNPFAFIDNNNIPTSSLIGPGVHLVEVGKYILANNFVDDLNNFLRIRKMHRLLP